MVEEIKSIVIGIVIWTLFIVSSVVIISSFNSEHPGMMTSTDIQGFNNTFNTYNNATQFIGNLSSGLTTANTDFGLFGVLNSLINSAWQVLRVTVTSLGFMLTSLTGFTTLFGIPAWIVGLLSLLITIIIVYAIFSVIFQR